MAATRKIPVRIDERKRTATSDHLIPSPAESPSGGFVSTKSGKECARGMVVYLGSDVTPEMMLERYGQVSQIPFDRARALLRFAAYCEALQSVKIGNVVSLSYSTDGLPLLAVEEDTFLSGTEARLP